MSSRSLLAFTAGTAGAIILSYCIYYDQKRRSDPEYKRKVHQRRQRDINNDDNQATAHQNDIPLYDTSDHSALEQSFYNEMKVGEQLISNGNIADGVSHFANALMMCAQPLPLFQTFQESLPDFVFMPLLMKLTELQSNSSSNKDNSISTPDPV
ncbi:mitochondrial import receptor subunit TOM20 homolog [Drosophila innubila]|uniref:mitochondrial import receptor subunit TOM20 homolog n=1 Tax=Drosophila innubila TaxID=198719 RepID=UPI00148BD2E5|nr:mitochondrial import receptor subunit TOM20 homolog [Drosophila innubila]